MTANTLRVTTLLLAALVSACRSTPPSEPTADADPPAVAVTIWSPRTELFMEYPPLVAGADARFAIHLTDLSSFEPLRDGKVVVRFEGDTVHRFDVSGPSTPGIFGVSVKVPPARRYQLTVEVHSQRVKDELALGAVTVYPNQEAALASVGGDDEEGGVSFLKEQQWTLGFATSTVDAAPRRQIMSVPATIEPRAGGSAEVRAPSAGRIAAGAGLPMGARVAAGSPLAEIVVRNDRLGEAPVLRLEVAQAEASLRLAQEDLGRVERLAAAGAVPQRRLSEARAAHETAASRLRIAQEQLDHLELSRTGAGAGRAAERAVIRAPLSGIVAQSEVTPGATVEEGQLLYRIVAVDRVHVIGSVPEQQLGRLEGVSEAEIEAPALSAPLKTAKLVSVGRVVDPNRRSVPVTFELVNPPPAIAVGQGVTLRLITTAKDSETAVPADAVVDDGGQPIVFVQTGGETFERRPVQVGGAREGGFVHIVSGITAGERVVTKGAHLVRLAALSPQTPAHGHVH